MTWHSLPLVIGAPATLCNPKPSYVISGDVVYLTGLMTVPSGFNGQIAVLPTAARPAHYLYMLASNDGAGVAPADTYAMLRIDPSGAVFIFSPPNGSADDVSLSGLSFHLLS